MPLVLEVGPLGLRGRERFELLVVTPRWLQARHGRRGAIPGRGKLIVFEWDLDRLRACISRARSSAAAAGPGPTWRGRSGGLPSGRVTAAR